MKRVLVTGGNGIVGRFIAAKLAECGHRVTVAGRTKPSQPDCDFIPFDLDPDFDFGALVDGYDWLVHAAFSHVPGRYRGGEGEDPGDFVRRNHHGTLALFEAAAAAGVKRGVLLSSRAVYGVQPPGIELSEDTACHPDTLYGEVKLTCEHHLAALAERTDMAVASLRVTGVYGRLLPGDEHKWSALIDDYLSGNPIEPRCGTEVHGSDVAEAVRIMLEEPPEPLAAGLFNVSDLLLDRRDLLAIVQQLTGCSHPLPARADASRYNSMDTSRLRALGWKPGGRDLLERSVAAILSGHVSDRP